MISFFSMFALSGARKTPYFLDVVVTFSYLRFHWFLLVFISIILIEAAIYYIFWKDLSTSFKISVVTNICSSLVAVPILLLSHLSSGWLGLISAAELFVTEEESTRMFHTIIIILFFFVPTCLVSIFIELNIGNFLRSSQENDLKVYTIANSIPYASIVIILVSLGYFFGLTNQNPTLDSSDFFSDWLFLSLEQEYVPAFFSIISGYDGFILSIVLAIAIIIAIQYIKSTKSPVTTHSPEDK